MSVWAVHRARNHTFMWHFARTTRLAFRTCFCFSFPFSSSFGRFDHRDTMEPFAKCYAANRAELPFPTDSFSFFVQFRNEFFSWLCYNSYGNFARRWRLQLKKIYCDHERPNEKSWLSNISISLTGIKIIINEIINRIWIAMVLRNHLERRR